MAQAMLDGRAVAAVALAAQEANPGPGGRSPLYGRGRLVCRAVVNDQDLEVLDFRSGPERGGEILEDAADGLLFVVDRDDHAQGWHLAALARA